jgi:hypothetical protein
MGITAPRGPKESHRGPADGHVGYVQQSGFGRKAPVEQNLPDGNVGWRDAADMAGTEGARSRQRQGR